MREIKFRAWDQDGKMMWGTNNVLLQFHKIIGNKRFILEQFTGLLDKNGKEIYDGDILGMPLQGISKVGGLFGKHFQWCAAVFWLVDRWTIHKNERGRDWKHSTPIDYYTEYYEVKYLHEGFKPVPLI